MQPLTFFATAAKGIETLLAEELKQLGLSQVKETRAGVYFEGTLVNAYRACLWSRVANRVLLPIAKFRAISDDELYSSVKKIDWSRHMLASQKLAVDASVSNSNIRHSQYAALKTKDAIADFFRETTGERPSVQTDKPDLQINLYINNDEAQLSIDLSGESLHQRGYRTRGSVAPLKENLAAAILYRAKWPEIAKQGGAFVDFMCGSGTLPVEAAMMACDIAPGIEREYFGFRGWRQHDEKDWISLLEEARARRVEGLKQPPKVFGFDHHRPSLERAEQHVSQAGLGDVVKIDYQDVFGFQLDKTQTGLAMTGLVVLNPPYGKRLGDENELSALYGEIGKVLMNHFHGWKVAVFVDDQAKGKDLGIRANRIHALYNGALACKLLHFDIEETNILRQYRLPRLLSDEELSEQARGFSNRLKKNLKKFKRWSDQENISCYRVYDADLPDYAVAIDLYQGEKLWVNIQEYEAPKSIDPDKAKVRIREVVSIIKETLGLDESEIFLKRRSRQRGSSQYEKLAAENNFKVVPEGNCQFWVNFEDYLDTGLFLDHRPLRLRIATLSEGKSLLNLFAYTGSMTVHAARGGARRTLTVDMSRTYIDWSKRNMQLNDQTGENHRFLRTDCLSWLAKPTEKKKYDLIFLDPPSFSNSKRMKQVFDVQKDHVRLIEQAMSLLEKDGILFFSSNLRGFKLDGSGLSDYLVNEITAQTNPFDFKQRKHEHRCWEIHYLT